MAYNATVPLLSIYSREMKTYVHIKTCTRAFIAALFIITENNPNVPKLRFIHTVETPQQQNEQTADTQNMWVSAKSVMQRNRSQT